MRSVLRWLVFAAVVAASIVTAAAAYQLADRAWSGVVDYSSPYLDGDLPVSAEGSATADRTVLVIVDGLRLDASRRMSSLEALRGYGADLTVRTSQPSLSYPNWTTILSGAPQDIHGVVTNWHEGPAPAETIIDSAQRAQTTFVVVGPSDIATLYPAVTRAAGSFFLDWSDEYLSDRYVDETLRLVDRHEPSLVVLHLPDIDETAHENGGASEEYAAMVARVDLDIRRLVEALQDGRTAFVFVADHGHIDTGGHGGWESEVVDVPAVMAGAGVRSFAGRARQEDVAPTVAVLAGLPVPKHATGEPIQEALSEPDSYGVDAAARQRSAAINDYAAVLLAPTAQSAAPLAPDGASGAELTAHLDEARATRLAFDREARSTGPALLLALGALAVMGLSALVSWRAFVAAFVGTIAYYAIYNTLFFVVRGNRWSLSSFNSEDLIEAWMNTRLVEAAIAGLLAALVAAFVYTRLRREPKGPRGRYLAGWLTLGPLTVLITQATLALQVAWFMWAWGVEPVWGMPDLKWGFKFDLDLIQATALGAAALLAPVVSYAVGRYHPRTRIRSASGEGGAKAMSSFAESSPEAHSNPE